MTRFNLLQKLSPLPIPPPLGIPIIEDPSRVERPYVGPPKVFIKNEGRLTDNVNFFNTTTNDHYGDPLERMDTKMTPIEITLEKQTEYIDIKSKRTFLSGGGWLRQLPPDSMVIKNSKLTTMHRMETTNDEFFPTPKQQEEENEKQEKELIKLELEKKQRESIPITKNTETFDPATCHIPIRYQKFPEFMTIPSSGGSSSGVSIPYYNSPNFNSITNSITLSQQNQKHPYLNPHSKHFAGIRLTELLLPGKKGHSILYGNPRDALPLIFPINEREFIPVPVRRKRPGFMENTGLPTGWAQHYDILHGSPISRIHSNFIDDTETNPHFAFQKLEATQEVKKNYRNLF